MFARSEGKTGLLLAFLAGSWAWSAASGQVYQAAIGSPLLEITHDIISTRDCGFQIMGAELGSGSNVRMSSARLDADANVLWTRTYSTSTSGATIGFTLFESVASDDIVLGAESLLGTPFPQRRKLIVRTDAAGTQLWAVMLPGTSATSSVATGTPGLGVSVGEVAGALVASVNRILNVNAVQRVGVLSVLNRAGDLEFSSRYVPAGGDTTELDFAQVRAPKFPAGTTDILVVGNIHSGTGVYGAFAMRTDVAGNIIWAREYRHETPGISTTADGFDLDENGDIVFSGRRGIAIPGQLSPVETMVAKIDAITGLPIWALDVDGFLNGYQAVTVAPDGSVLVAGDYRVGNTTAASVVQISASGTFQTQRIYGSQVAGAIVHANAVINASLWGGFAIAGITEEFGLGGQDNYLIKMYSTFESGCNEDRISPNTARVELGSSARNPQVVNDPAYLLLEAIEITPVWDTKTSCFKSLCVGDLNGDGLVEDSDFVIFAFAYDTLVCPTLPAIYSCCPADFNDDGLVDDADFVQFAAAYDLLVCP